MHPTRQQTNAVKRFSCLGADCPDTCCQGWGMQVTADVFARYQAEAPELLDAVTDAEAEHVMRRDPATDICVKFDEGLCSIHRDYGDGFLGDACHFYPRITRALGSRVLTTASLSCPEAARQLLTMPDGLELTEREEIRVPYSLKNYLPAGLSEDDALDMHGQFIAIARDEAFTAEHHVMRISALTQALSMQPVGAWKDAMPFYLSMVEGRIPAPEPAAADLFNLLHATHGLMRASPKPHPPLVGLLDEIAEKLGVSFDGAGGISLRQDAAQCGVKFLAHMREQSAVLQPIYRRYLAAQMSQALFPFAGLGGNLAERLTIIGVRFATTKLALATLPVEAPQEAVVSVVQVLARFMDHLADPSLSLQIYAETGWIREARLRALLGDA